MKNFWMIIISLAVLLLAAFGCSPTGQEPKSSSADLLPVTENIKNFSWVVDPKFDYERIERWGDDDYFAGTGFDTDDSKFFLIDPLTGDKANREAPATDRHGGYLSYDPDKEIWGINIWVYFMVLGNRPENLEHYWEGYKLPQVFPVMKVNILKENPQDGEDLEITTKTDVNDNVLSTPQIKYEPTKFAIGDKNGSISEFLFDNTEEGFVGDYIAASKDGKWGIVDQKGNWVIEPVFESFMTNDGLEFAGVVSIDGSAFFARKDGKWGIIKIAE